MGSNFSIVRDLDKKLNFKENVFWMTNRTIPNLTVPNHFLTEKRENRHIFYTLWFALFKWRTYFSTFHGAIHGKNRKKKNFAIFGLSLSHKKRETVYFCREMPFLKSAVRSLPFVIIDLILNSYSLKIFTWSVNFYIPIFCILDP